MLYRCRYIVPFDVWFCQGRHHRVQVIFFRRQVVMSTHQITRNKLKLSTMKMCNYVKQNAYIWNTTFKKRIRMSLVSNCIYMDRSMKWQYKANVLCEQNWFDRRTWIEMNVTRYRSKIVENHTLQELKEPIIERRWGDSERLRKQNQDTIYEHHQEFGTLRPEKKE